MMCLARFLTEDVIGVGVGWQLLKLGAEIMFMDRRNSTALHYAAYNGHSETVAVLTQTANHLHPLLLNPPAALMPPCLLSVTLCP